MSIANGPKEKVRSRNKQTESPTADSTVTSGQPPRPMVEENPDVEFQLQLGSSMLQAVDRLTGMSADDIEVVADRVMDGAREIEEALRELAGRVRQYGLLANENLATFVSATNKCTETARAMQGMLGESASHIPTEPSSQDKGAARHDRSEYPTDLSALEAEIEAFSSERAPPLQPRD